MARLADATNEIGQILLDLGRPEEALVTCRRFLKRHPDQTAVIWNMSLRLLLLGQFEEGRRAYEHRFDIATVACALIWQICLFLIPMQLLTHNVAGMETTIPIFLAGCVGLYFLWWKNLPDANEKIADFVRRPPAQSPEELKEIEALAK